MIGQMKYHCARRRYLQCLFVSEGGAGVAGPSGMKGNKIDFAKGFLKTREMYFARINELSADSLLIKQVSLRKFTFNECLFKLCLSILYRSNKLNLSIANYLTIF